MKRISITLAVLVSIVLAGCESTTPVEPPGADAIEGRWKVLDPYETWEDGVHRVRSVGDVMWEFEDGIFTTTISGRSMHGGTYIVLEKPRVLVVEAPGGLTSFWTYEFQSADRMVLTLMADEPLGDGISRATVAVARLQRMEEN